MRIKLYYNLWFEIDSSMRGSVNSKPKIIQFNPQVMVSLFRSAACKVQGHFLTRDGVDISSARDSVDDIGHGPSLTENFC